MYLPKYLTKDQVALTSSLAIIKDASEKVKKYPSTAPDAGTDLRTGKYLLTAILNSLTGLCEISSTQAAVSLLGMPAQEGSARVGYVFMPNAVAAVRERELRCRGENPEMAWREENILDGNGNGSTSEGPLEPQHPQGEEGADPAREEEREEREELDIVDAIETGAPTGKVTFGGAQIFRVPDADGKMKIIGVTQDQSYAHRGVALLELNLLEYTCIIEVVPKRQRGEADKEREEENGEADKEAEEIKTGTSNAGRPTSTTFDLGPLHPLHGTHTQRIRSKLLVPILTGMSPPSFAHLEAPDMGYSNCTRAGEILFTPSPYPDH